ncbi:MAG: rhomboid family intramembrane serine protease [Armatimonadota bacterium]|nr:rhomboid family intramembrane serine protease [bacterium]
MIPLADDNPTRTKPYVVYILILLNVLVYLYDRMGALGSIGRLWDWSMIPSFVINGHPITKTIPVLVNGAQRAAEITYTGLHPRWLTIFSSMFMHGSLLHIGGNMLYLWIFGNNIEDSLGHAKFVAFYLLCGVIAALAHMAVNIHSQVPTVGASGAIAGVLGAYLMLYPKQDIRTLVFLGFFWTFIEVPALIVLGVWFVTQLLGLAGSGGMMGGGVAYGAHVGGFVAGIALILLFGGRKLVSGTRYYRRSPRYDDAPDKWRSL